MSCSNWFGGPVTKGSFQIHSIPIKLPYSYLVSMGDVWSDHFTEPIWRDFRDFYSVCRGAGKLKEPLKMLPTSSNVKCLCKSTGTTPQGAITLPQPQIPSSSIIRERQLGMFLVSLKIVLLLWLFVLAWLSMPRSPSTACQPPPSQHTSSMK